MASSSSRSATPGTSTSESETEYCVRVTNYIISTLKLPIAQLRTLQDLEVEYLLKMHCKLHGIDYASDFIPSAHSSEDVARVILFLKDRYGAGQFNALEANKIAEKNPTQLRFLLEIFHLILNHKLTRRASKPKQPQMVTSESGHHLSVGGISSKDISKADSYYVLPTLYAEETQETMDESSLDPISEVNETDTSFQTVENIVINVVNESMTEDDPSESKLDESVQNDQTFHSREEIPSQKEKVNKQVSKQSPAPLTSSPIGKERKLSKSNQSPNVSAIRKSQSTTSNLQRTINSTNPSNSSKTRGHSIPRNISHTNQNNPQPTEKDTVKLLAKNDYFGKGPNSVRQTTSKQPKQNQPQQKSSETQFMSTTASDCFDPNDVEDLTLLRDIHSQLRCQITESLICLDKDISKLKKKKKKPPPQSKLSIGPISRGLFPKNLPGDLRWLLPVDARFPTYTKSVIIPKCTSWRSNLKQPVRATTRTPSFDTCLKSCNSKNYSKRYYSTLAQMGSLCEDKLELSEEESTDE